MLRLLFVCTGNTCRSVMAEAIFKHYWSISQRSDKISVGSAGINAVEGSNAALEVKRLLAEEGVGLSDHSAKNLTPEMINYASLILVMTVDQKKILENKYPEARGKVKLLKEFAGSAERNYNIADPFGGNIEIYKNTLQDIKKAILKLIKKLEEKNNGRD